jgi:hypothetical protein
MKFKTRMLLTSAVPLVGVSVLIFLVKSPSSKPKIIQAASTPAKAEIVRPAAIPAPAPARAESKPKTLTINSMATTLGVAYDSTGRDSFQITGNGTIF